MCRRDGEMYLHFARGTARIQGSLHQMFFESCPHFIPVPVEKHLSLRSVAIVEPRFAACRCSLPDHMVQDSIRSEAFEILLGVKGEPADIVYKLAGL